MLAAIVGDVAGSEWEFRRNKDPDVRLFGPEAAFTDDTVCTCAVARWLMDGGDLREHLLQWGRFHLSRGFGGKFLEWLTSNDPQPYGSFGNGSAMRVSAVALWAQNDDELMDLAARSAAPTHNHPDAIRGAQAAAWAARQALLGVAGEELLRQVGEKFGFSYAGLLDRDPVAERPTHRFDVTCDGTVPLALVCAVRGGSFEGALRLCVAMGGDADTLAAIAGPVADGLYGGVPEWMGVATKHVVSTEDGVWQTLEDFYGRTRVQKTLLRAQRSNPTMPLMAYSLRDQRKA